MTRTIYCQTCKTTVDVLDGRVAMHGGCRIGGSIYRPERIHRSGSGRPHAEITSVHEEKMTCDHGHEHTALVIEGKMFGNPNAN